MSIQPDGGDWAQWLTLVFSAAIAVLSGVASGSFFAGQAKQEIKALRERMDQAVSDRDQMRVDIRTAVHDMRGELQKTVAASAKSEDIKRIEAHLVRQDIKNEDRFTEVVRLLVGGRQDRAG